MTDTKLPDYVLVPREPTEAMLKSMAVRYDHGLGVPGYYDQPMFVGLQLSHAQRFESTLRTMRQLYEEATGQGFCTIPQPAPQGEPVAWRITDGEGGYAHREPPPSAFDVEWAKRYGRNFEPLYAHPDPRVAELSAEVEAKQRVAFQAQEMAREIASKLAAAEKEVERLSAYGDACTQAEREACAKLAEKLGLITDDSGRVRLGDVDCIAATIRAR